MVRTPVLMLLFLLPIILHSCEKDPVDESEVAEVFVRFKCDKSLVLMGDSIHFINTSENATSFYWEFGDGESSREQNPVHHYKDYGDFRVELYAISGEDSSSYSHMVHVRERQLRIMSYNIAFSGGAVLELYPMWQRDGHGSWNVDRRDELAAIINEFDPDILGIQEAMCWYHGDPKVVESFSRQIGMEYYIYPEYIEAEWNGLVIYSKYPLRKIKKLYHQACVPDQVWNGLYLLGAEVELDSSTKLDFYSCHLMFHVEGAQACEMKKLREYFVSMDGHRSILVGDMNWAVDQSYTKMMNEAGLYYVDPDGQGQIPDNIDQVWTSSGYRGGAQSYDWGNIEGLLPKEVFELLRVASDHHPVMARVYI